MLNSLFLLLPEARDGIITINVLSPAGQPLVNVSYRYKTDRRSGTATSNADGVIAVALKLGEERLSGIVAGSEEFVPVELGFTQHGSAWFVFRQWPLTFLQSNFGYCNLFEIETNVMSRCTEVILPRLNHLDLLSYSTITNLGGRIHLSYEQKQAPVRAEEVHNLESYVQLPELAKLYNPAWPIGYWDAFNGFEWSNIQLKALLSALSNPQLDDHLRRLGAQEMLRALQIASQPGQSFEASRRQIAERLDSDLSIIRRIQQQIEERRNK